MTDEPDAAYLRRDDALATASKLSARILENANAFRALGEPEPFPGQDRARFLILLVMMDEMGKLDDLVREIWRAARAEHTDVRVEGFHDNVRAGRKALAEILGELRLSDKASRMLGGDESASVPTETPFMREDYGGLMGRTMWFQLMKEDRDMSFIPDAGQMDRIGELIERNAVADGEYIAGLAKRLNLWIPPELKESRDDSGRVRYR